MNRFIISLVLSLGILGCSAERSGPPTVNTSSESQLELTERIRFLEQYITFRRRYNQLEYRVQFLNGGGLVPSPSEWDIKILAVIPKEDIQEWIPHKIQPSKTPYQWISDIPGDIPTAGITEWYQDEQRTIGIDRANSIIAYRNFAM